MKTWSYLNIVEHRRAAVGSELLVVVSDCTVAVVAIDKAEVKLGPGAAGGAEEALACEQVGQG